MFVQHIFFLLQMYIFEGQKLFGTKNKTISKSYFQQTFTLLSGNSTLPVGMDGLTSLERLNLSHNRLEHLPITLGNLPKLR